MSSKLFLRLSLGITSYEREGGMGNGEIEIECRGGSYENKFNSILILGVKKIFYKIIGFILFLKYSIPLIKYFTLKSAS